MSLTQVDGGLLSPTNGQFYGFKNRLINPTMAVDQRNAGAVQTITAGAALAYTVDRWYAYSTGANVVGGQTSAKRYQFSGAASVTAIGFGQRIESLNCYDLAGTTAVLSCYISNTLLTTVTWTASYANTSDTFGSLASPTVTQIATGTFTVTSTRTQYSASISIPSAATTGLQIVFSVGAQISGTWTIDSVQLEKGSTATSFDYRPYGTELVLCQRYFEKSYDQSVAVGAVNQNGVNSTVAYQAATNRPFWSVKFGVTKRTSASVTLYTPNTLNTSGKIGGPSGADVSATVTNAGDSTFSLYQSGTPPSNSADYYAHWVASAEL